jgi:hypothetical protein
MQYIFLHCWDGARKKNKLFQEMKNYEIINFWVECVLQSIIAVAGFLANLIVIPILCRYPI